MLYIPAPAVTEVRVVDLFDEPQFNGTFTDPKDTTNFGKPKPYLQKYHEFLLTRLPDESFIDHGGKKEGVDYIEIIQLARRQIKATIGVAGYHAFDDEVCKRLRNAILKPKAGTIGNAQFEHNWVDWVLLWKAEPLTSPPAVLEPQLPALVEGLS